MEGRRARKAARGLDKRGYQVYTPLETEGLIREVLELKWGIGRGQLIQAILGRVRGEQRFNFSTA